MVNLALANLASRVHWKVDYGDIKKHQKHHRWRVDYILLRRLRETNVEGGGYDL